MQSLKDLTTKLAGDLFIFTFSFDFILKKFFESRAKQFSEQPSLVEISRETQSASAAKYGQVGNDRIFQNRL
jgi:hypothetical protein